MSALHKVLVVDDDPVVGASFHRVLSGKGYPVVSAENGADALEKLRAEHFDAVFTDLRMPGMDGLQVAERVRASQPWLPVVVVTGYGSPANEERARAAGVTDFLRKPLSPEMIETSAERAVRTLPEAVSAPAAAMPEAAPTVAAPRAEEAPQGSMLRNMALFLVAPFVGLAYMLLLPFVGLGLLAWTAFFAKKEVQDTGQVTAARAGAPERVAVRVAAAAPAAQVRTGNDALEIVKLVAKVAAAPFIGLAWIVALPFAGLGALAWFGLKAAFGRTAAE